MTTTKQAPASEEERRAYYTAALRCLRFVEARKPTGRRFGREADARWESFKGHLVTADRLDLLIRDADAEWPSAFGARLVFALRAVAEDDAFGPDWEPLDPVLAEEIWRAELAQPGLATAPDALAAIAAAWKIQLHPLGADPLDPADKLLVVGPSAVAGAAITFAARADLDWSEQVICVATSPAHRQLATTSAAIANAPRPTRLVAADEVPADLTLPRRIFVSADAAPADYRRATELTTGGSGGAR
jgi:hypothetical protein